jgi:hypothetical protein
MSRNLLRYTRLTHLYLGVFIAPALLFFAFTGALQTFSLHETTRGISYKPPHWAVVLGQLHKKQTTVIPNRKLPPPEKPAADKSQSPAASASNAEVPTAKPHNTLPLKLFFLLVAIGLFTSTISGLYMSYKFIRNKALITAILIAGMIVPVLMAIF